MNCIFLKLCRLVAVCVIILIASPIANAQRGASADQEIATIRQKCRLLLLANVPYATEQSYLLTDISYSTKGEGYFKALSTNGSWNDIDYKADIHNAWPPSWHLYRLMLVYRAYHKNKNPLYLEAVHRGLSYWIKNDFKCGNWWQNQINVPFAYSSLLLMMSSDAQPAEISYMDNTLLPRVPQKGATGQNKIWQHDAEARIALFHNDVKTFKASMDNMQSVITISTAEGIQPDYSFLQHGPMLQFGNYGLHFVNSLLFWMNVSGNSTYGFDAHKQQIIRDYCIKGLRYTVFQKGMDITAIGRQMQKNSSLKRGYNLRDDFSLLQSAAKSNSCNYSLDGFAPAGCSISENKGFWRSAYMVQLQSNRYAMSVKMQGAFFRPVESINLENLKGAFLNDGVTLMQRSGKEYRDIQPLWNWAMLPGTTCDTTLNPADRKVFDAPNRSDFVGLVSDGKAGISAMYYNRLGVSGYKSYFFIDDALIALGADLAAPDSKNLVTTVNQRFKNNKPVISGMAKGGQRWIWHDSTAYYFPAGQIVQVKSELKSGSWNTIDKSSPDELISDSVTTTYIGHTQSNTYAYCIKPGVGLTAAKNMAAAPAFKIIQNTKLVQAIYAGGKYMVVFYQPGELKLSATATLKADAPCLVIIEKSREAWVADPTRKLETISLALNGKTIKITLPNGNYSGSPVKAIMSK